MEGPFCPPADASFQLIETFLWTPKDGVVRRDRHVARLRRTAAKFDIALPNIDAELDALSGSGPLRVRLTVDRNGSLTLAQTPFTALSEGAVWRLGAAEQKLRADDPWLGVKSTQRAIYDAARANLPSELDELIYCNDDGWLCEGTITNIFVDQGEGLLTPPLDCGVLPGVLREELLEMGRAREVRLRLNDLAICDRIYVGNSLRGLIPARLCTPAPRDGRPRRSDH